MQCPECGADIDAGVRYCQECGEEINMPDDPGGEGGGDGLATKIPGMKPGSTIRNVVVGAVIVVVALSVLGAAIPGGDAPDNSQADAAPDPTATPVDADTPQDEGSAEGSAGGAEPTSEPTDKPTEEPTDEPTPDPTAEPTATPTATPRPEPDPQSFSGNGQSVESGIAIEGGFTVVEMEHDGESNFQVELIDEETGETHELLANEIGTWESIYALYVPPGEYTLDINADGDWNIDVRQPRDSQADVQQLPVDGSDSYPNYLGPIEFDGLATFTADYEGDSNFVVWVLDANGQEVDLIFNEIGPFEGEATFNGNGVGYVRVEATGDWTLEIE